MNLAHHSVRRVTYVAALAIAALTVSSCAGGLVGSAPAATVNGTEISQDDVEELTKAYVNTYQQQLDSGQDQTGQVAGLLAESAGDSDEAFSMTSANSALTELIANELVLQELERLDKVPSGEDLEAVRAELEQQMGGAEGLEAIDATLVDYTVQTRAAQTAFQATLEPDPVGREEQLLELYETAVTETPLCLNLIYVQSEAEAQSVMDRVESGEDFGVVAAEVSLAGATVEDRGFGGCASYEQGEGLLGVPLEGEAAGFVSGPHTFDTQDGTPPSFVVVEIESVDGVDFERLRPQLEAQLPPEDPAALAQEAVGRLTSGAEITVDPRYGSWDEESLTVIAPPVPGPSVALEPEPVLLPEN